MHRFIMALSCFLMTLAAPISAQNFEKGVAAYNRGDYATAFKEWKPLADAGGLLALTTSRRAALLRRLSKRFV